MCHCVICLLRSLTPGQTSDTLLLLVYSELELSKHSISLSSLCTLFNQCLCRLSFSSSFSFPIQSSVLLLFSILVFTFSILTFLFFLLLYDYKHFLRLAQVKEFAESHLINFFNSCKGKIHYLQSIHEHIFGATGKVALGDKFYHISGVIFPYNAVLRSYHVIMYSSFISKVIISYI